MLTKTGRPIELIRHEDAEGDCNRGWRVDMLQAWVDGQEAGYLKISYIPQSRFDSHYKAGALSYMDLIAGHGIFPRSFLRKGDLDDAQRNHDVYRLSDPDLRRLVCNAAWILKIQDLSSNGQAEQMTRSQLLDEVSALTEQADKRVGRKFQLFKDFHIDKPLVDYIGVVEPMRRQGIARALYVEGAFWMAEKGLRLYASGLQQREAVMAWQSMGDWVSQEGDRRYLDVTKIGEQPLPTRAHRPKQR